MSLGCFKAVYRGGIPVKEIEGFRVVQQAGGLVCVLAVLWTLLAACSALACTAHTVRVCAALRVKDFGLEPKKVTLVVTQGQLIVIEKDTGDHMHEVNVSNISYR